MADQMIFKRCEIKYMLDITQAELLKNQMKQYMTADEHGMSTICSLYFDTPDYLLIQRSMEHPVYKEKLRLRSYGTADKDTTVFVELKKKYESVVYKRRIAMTEDEAERYLLFHEKVKDTQITREIDYCLKNYKKLSPAVMLSYEREAFYAKDDHEFRITFDQNILWRNYDLSLCKGIYGEAILDKNNIEEYIKNKNTLQGIVKNCDEQYNLHIDLGNNIEGIIPRKEVEGINIEKDGLPKTNLCTGKVNRYVQFKVQKVSDENVALLSRREVQKEALNWVKTNLNPGDEVIGIVKRIENYGVFVEIGGGIVGLAHIEDLSIARIKTPFERLKIGQKINIMVKSVNREDGRIILSYKEMLGTWEENAKLFTAGMKAHGIVRETEKNKNGIFIELMPNLVGMAEYEEGLEYGQKVDVYIKKIDYERKKVKLLVV